MRKFTVITKDGSKWLRARIRIPHDFLDSVEFVEFPYMGSHPEGTTLDESEVKEVRQYQTTEFGSLTWYTADDEYEINRWRERNPSGFETRTAYTDAESHDRHISNNPRYPLFSHMSSEHGLTLLDSELDEIARHAAPMTGVDYWKRRCKAAERFIEQTPCDHDITPKQIEAHEAWQEIIEEGRAYGN